MKTLNDLFLGELADIYDAERRLARLLPKLAKAASLQALKHAIRQHGAEIAGHLTRVETVFKQFETRARGRTCEATVGLVKEAEALLKEFSGTPVLDAAIVGALQKIEHYEIATYGCLHSWAGVLNNKTAAASLQEILDEEKAMNVTLIGLAHEHCNTEGLNGSESSGQGTRVSRNKAKTPSPRFQPSPLVIGKPQVATLDSPSESENL